jgi:hypothetical protein
LSGLCRGLMCRRSPVASLPSGAARWIRKVQVAQPVHRRGVAVGLLVAAPPATSPRSRFAGRGLPRPSHEFQGNGPCRSDAWGVGVGGWYRDRGRRTAAGSGQVRQEFLPWPSYPEKGFT